jgi:hypothetical protein
MIALVLAALGGLAAQSPCDTRGLSDGPLLLGFEQADFGVARRACPRSEIGLGAGGRAIIDEPSFYARLHGGGRFDFTLQPVDQLELALMLEPLVYEQVIQSFRASYFGLGDASLSGTLLVFTRDTIALSTLARVTLPTAMGYWGHSSPWGIDAGLLSTVEPFTWLRLHGALLGMAGWAVTKADADPRGAIALSLASDIVLFSWLALVLDSSAQVLERDPLDRITVGGGVRAALGDLGAELGVRVPVAGADRHLASAGLRITWRVW